MLLNPQTKLLWHGDRVKKWLEGEEIAPILVEVAPVGYCNAACPWCFFKGKLDGGRIDGETMIRALKSMAKMGVKAINWTGGGEPTLHPEFDQFVEIAASLGLEQGLFTNAYLHIKNPGLFKWIRITLTDKEFRFIKKPAINGYFGICVNMVEGTPKEKLEEWCEIARSLDAGYFQVRPALAGRWEDQPKLDPPFYLKEYETEDFKVLLTLYKFKEATRPREYDRCYGYRFCPSIDWRGKVGVCLYRMGEKDYVFGDLEDESFGTLIRRILPKDLVDEGCQNCCKNHEINKILFEAKKVEHVNFL